MEWVVFSILAGFMWAGISVVDKLVVTKWVDNPRVPIIFLGLTGLAAAGFVYVFRGFALMPPVIIAITCLAGVSYVIASIFWFKAVSLEEVSRIAPLLHLIPLFVLIFAAIFLGEIFTTMTYVGIFLLIFGAFVISTKDVTRFRPGKAVSYIIIANIFFAIMFIIMKFSLNYADFWTVFAYIRLGAAFGIIPLIFMYYSDVIRLIRKHRAKPVIVMVTNEIIDTFAILFFTIAASTGFITLVEAMASMQSLFVLIIIVVMSKFLPRLHAEDISKNTLIQKIIGSLCLLTGAVLII